MPKGTVTPIICRCTEKKDYPHGPHATGIHLDEVRNVAWPFTPEERIAAAAKRARERQERPWDVDPTDRHHDAEG